VIFFVHRLAALYLRLRRKRPPLDDMLSAWAGGRWHHGVYKSAKKSAGAARVA
jgi:hypothetical protein